MVKVLVLTDGRAFTDRYVNALLSEGHDVYVQVAPGVTQTTKGKTKVIDLFNTADLQQALVDVSFVAIIGEPIRSYTALTQVRKQDRQQLVYDNLAQAISQSHVQHVLVMQSKPVKCLKEIFAAYEIPVTYALRHKNYLQQGRNVLSQVSRDIHTVRSVQSLTIPEGITMEGALSFYGRFLRTLNGRLINGVYDGENFTILLAPFNLPLIRMQHAQQSDRVNRVVMNITGGLMVGASERQPRFEIRRCPQDAAQCLIGLHDFVPRLPWGIYKYTQAPIHVIVSFLFGKYWEKFQQ
ncbi:MULTISPECIES: hypothetical protein [unclassified Staphylococcus]|uniref:hypothetical protein n=1 Tax=unclassified Staphylococcus TaxID=91994 RepID=UPI0021CF0255|nr:MULTISPECIES: hypothetical protein [unclassified Staphylococcus]UXR78180.1 hypothetical protein MUA92_10175 [Staphylococcus sp. IVB6227]UXR82343.1 hypothetical protein MUA51_09895 [Staphylococcus sp. IVB6214]